MCYRTIESMSEFVWDLLQAAIPIRGGIDRLRLEDPHGIPHTRPSSLPMEPMKNDGAYTRVQRTRRM